jgi:hypothetical protein
MNSNGTIRKIEQIRTNTLFDMQSLLFLWLKSWLRLGVSGCVSPPVREHPLSSCGYRMKAAFPLNTTPSFRTKDRSINGSEWGIAN